MLAIPDQMQRLNAARHKVAQLVLIDLIYLPILERLNSEIEELAAKQNLINQARSLVSDYKATG